ncbi:hypothetical protein [Streptomyces prunicolor]
MKAESESDYAKYSADVTAHFDDCGQEGMQVTVDQRDDIVRALGAATRARRQKTGIIADELSSTVGFSTEVPHGGVRG